AFSGSGGARAQTAESEEVIFELSPFTVVSDDDAGYLARNTLAGSRLNSSLKDTAAAIDVFTREFIDDIGADNIEDVLAYSVNGEVDLEDSGPSASGGNQILENSFNFRVRGLSASKARNFFSWNMKMDNYNIDRLDESRGPNAILFGIGSPGGIYNISTKTAGTSKDFGSIGFAVGSNDYLRRTLDFNKVLVEDTLAIRLNAVVLDEGSNRFFEEHEKEAFHFAATYSPGERTTLMLEYEGADELDTRARPSTAYDLSSLWGESGSLVVDTSDPGNKFKNLKKDSSNGINQINKNNAYTVGIEEGGVENFQGFLVSTTDSIRLGSVMSDSSFSSPSMNLTGPGATRNMDYSVYSLVLQHGFAPNLNFEAAYSHSEEEQDGVDPLNNALNIYADPNSHLPSGEVNPFAGMYYTDAHWIRRARWQDTDQFRASLSYDLNTDSWGDHRLALMYEDKSWGVERIQQREVIAGAPNNANPEHARNRFYRRNYITPGVFDTMYASDWRRQVTWTDPQTEETFTTAWVSGSESGSFIDFKDMRSYTAVLQNFFFDDRLVTTLGYRKDDFETSDSTSFRDPVTREWTPTRDVTTEYSVAPVSRTFGAVSHLTKSVSGFFNYSTGTSLADPNMRVLPDSRLPEPTDDESMDFGLNLELFEGRSNLRLTYFEAETLAAAGFRNTTPIRNAHNDVWEAYELAGVIANELAESEYANIGAHYFDRRSSGYEANLVANLSENWRLMVKASKTDVVEDNIMPLIVAWSESQGEKWDALGSVDANGDPVTGGGLTVDELRAEFSDLIEEKTAFNGKPAYGNREDKFSAFTKYSFSSGLLDGFSLGGGYRYQSGNPIFVNAETDDVIEGPSYEIVDFVLGYGFKLEDGSKVRIQLNVTNLLDDETQLLSRMTSDGLPLRNSYLSPRSLRLSGTYSF
ncbi:MAG: TonB-dependent receptor plug domain-containing protein, partial [Verrucomicrobiota bacterium]